MGENGTVSSGDEERLPPGGFSLRHGFGGWFGRGGAGRRSRQVSGQSTEAECQPSGDGLTAPPLPPRPEQATGLGISPDHANTQSTPDKSFKTAISDIGSPSAIAFAQAQSLRPPPKPTPSIYDILIYLVSTFDSESVLDSIPLEAAGNPGAWHAWKARQQKSNPSSTATNSTSTPRKPGEWNWEGVWEERVKRGVNASLSEAVLFGRAGGDETINFLNMDEEDVKGVKENLFRTLGVDAPGVEEGEVVGTEVAF